MLNGLSVTEFEQSRWEVRRITYAIGRFHGFVNGLYYASHRSTGGRKTFCTVNFYTLESSVVEATGSLITSDVVVFRESTSRTIEVELAFGMQKSVVRMRTATSRGG